MNVWQIPNGKHFRKSPLGEKEIYIKLEPRETEMGWLVAYEANSFMLVLESEFYENFQLLDNLVIMRTSWGE